MVRRSLGEVRSAKAKLKRVLMPRSLDLISQAMKKERQILGRDVRVRQAF